MNKQYYVILFLLISLLFSCEKDDSGNSIAECDVNGVWIGEWESNQQITGTFCANVEQLVTDYSGNILIRIDGPDYDNYNRDFSGTVKNKHVRTIITIQGVEIAAEGNVENDSIVSGDFNVPSLSMHGTFTGKKIPTTEANQTKIYSSPQESEEHISDFIYIDNNLWVFMYPEEWFEAGYKTKVNKFDINGNLIGTVYYPGTLSGNISSDGNYIWELWNGTTISKFDTEGNKIESLDLPSSLYSHKIACGPEHLYLFSEDRIYKTDQSLNLIDSIVPRYNFPYAYTVYNNFQLYSYGNVLYKMNNTGEILQAFVLPDERFITDIETNGDKVWCFAYWFGENAANEMYPFRYSIYEINVE